MLKRGTEELSKNNPTTNAFSGEQLGVRPIGYKSNALQEQGIGYFVCNFFFGDMPHEKVMQSVKLFAKEVMPAFGVMG